MLARGNITKKFTRIEPQSTLRSDVTWPDTGWPPTSNTILSPSFRPSVFARPSSTLSPSASPGTHLPATILACFGSSLELLRFNSRWIMLDGSVSGL